MPSQQQIERFTLAFHRVAMARLRQDASLKLHALEVLDRWEADGASPSSKAYRDIWRELLQGDQSRLEAVICGDGERAATLRSGSPLGFLLPEAERLQIRREAMAT
jgi:hypothetical protein